MGLINLQTNLKSLRFGNDRVHSGNSGQPYIQTPIPEGETSILPSQDFVLRGGLYAFKDSAEDVLRLGKYFTDVRNPSGLLFVAKQNLLSRTAVRTQTSGLLLNEGAYTPLSTLVEAGGVAFGLHVNKQGLNPFDGIGSIRKYSEVVTPNQPVIINRLVDFYNTKEAVSTNNVNLYTYGGGPGSILGIGKTSIKLVDPLYRTGINNAYGKDIVAGTYLTDRASQTINRVSLTTPPLGVANKWFEATKLIDTVSTPNLSTDNGYTYITTDDVGNPVGPLYGNIKLGQWAKIPIVDVPPVLPPGAPIPENDNDLPKNGVFVSSNGTITYTQTQLLEIPTNTTSDGESVLVKDSSNTSKVGDFRALIRKTTNNYTVASAPNYTTKNIEGRTNLGDPGSSALKKINNYTNGVSGLGNASPNSYDRINALPIYQSNGPSQAKTNGTSITNDLVKFRIGVYDLTGDTNIPKNYLHFRAFLNNISDQYDADWNPTQYIGRGEKFYTYGGFNRKVSLSWTVAAQSKAELIPMYKKLNYLASVCAPDYSGAGYMRGNIVTLTVGGYFYEQPGIITGLNYEMNDDNATWEIGIPDSDVEPFVDPSVKELPHLIKVSGFNFIPIHNFVPRLQQNSFADTNANNVLIDNNSYGKERYIALNNGVNNNYDF